ncbi:hypothetical protein QVD17_04007 [Tagetes erecta]|uniref:Uncharacterized protein n=1 Tax=Tagetes erecta TaxID=13708 RepID=A0AAD8LB31_TARER|nr:hypothetical protein QVD17_04007 [Tagetes erecta]
MLNLERERSGESRRRGVIPEICCVACLLDPTHTLRMSQRPPPRFVYSIVTTAPITYLIHSSITSLLFLHTPIHFSHHQLQDPVL